MRGSDERSGSLFSYVDLEARVRVDHPLRVIRPAGRSKSPGYGHLKLPHLMIAVSAEQR